jgi:hypothetical protein
MKDEEPEPEATFGSAEYVVHISSFFPPNSTQVLQLP